VLWAREDNDVEQLNDNHVEQACVGAAAARATSSFAWMISARRGCVRMAMARFLALNVGYQAVGYKACPRVNAELHDLTCEARPGGFGIRFLVRKMNGGNPPDRQTNRMLRGS